MEPHPHARGFQALTTPDQWRDLLRHGARRPIRAGDVIIEQGYPGKLVYALELGRIRVTYTEENGHEALVAVRGPGDLVGEYAQRDGGVHMASVWTLEDSHAIAITSDRFETFIRRHELGEALQHYMLGKARQVGERIWRMANLRTEQRMAQLFLELVNAAPGNSPATIPMSQGLIASSLGVTRRSVNNLLARWREQGLVRTQPAPITVLDPAALARRAAMR